MSEQRKILEIIRDEFPQLAEVNLQEKIAEYGSLRHYQAGEIIMDYGSYVRSMPLLVSGTVKVSREDETGNEIFLYYLYPGETCSMSFSCCMMDKRSEIRTTAEEDTSLISIPVRYVDAWLTQYQSWKNFIMLAYDNKMYDLIKTIDSIAFKQMDARLLDYLEERSQATRSRILNTTHQVIAQDLNASREAISRLLKRLEVAGKVSLGRNQIKLHRLREGDYVS